MFKKFLLTALLLGAFLLVGVTAQAATSSLTASQTVANVADVMDTTGLATSTSVANDATEVKATTTFKIVLASPIASTTKSITVGQCVITFASTTAGAVTADGMTDSTSCASDAATIYIHTLTGSATTTRTATQLATAIAAVDNIYDASHGWLTSIATSTIYIAFGATSTPTLSTGIASTTLATEIITSDLGGNIDAVAKIAQEETITVGGTISTNNIYTVRSNGFSASYTALSTDTTAANIATGLSASITAASPTEYTNSVLSNVITLTAVTAGTAFDPATTTVARAQTVTFTPANVTVGERFLMAINSRTYSYVAVSGDNAGQVATGLVTDAASDTAVTCTNVSSTVSCSAKTAGTAFTYSTGVNSAVSSSGSSHSSGYAPTNNLIIAPATTDIQALQDKINALLITLRSLQAQRGIAQQDFSASDFGQQVRVIATDLQTGSRNEKVTILQQFLISQNKGSAAKALAKVGATAYFGNLTRAALAEFQAKAGIKPAVGYFGPITRAYILAH